MSACVEKRACLSKSHKHSKERGFVLTKAKLECCVVYSKLDAPPLSLSGFSPATQLGAILYKTIRRSRGETVGTRIDRDISLIMPLRLRGGYATECHALSYFSSSSALIFSPPLRLVFRF